MHKTLEAANTNSGSFDVVGGTTPRKTGKKLFRNITIEHANQALTNYLTSIRMIDADEEVTLFNKIGNNCEVKIERIS